MTAGSSPVCLLREGQNDVSIARARDLSICPAPKVKRSASAGKASDQGLRVLDLKRQLKVAGKGEAGPAHCRSGTVEEEK